MLKEWNLTSSSNANSVLTPTYSILNFVQNRRNNRLRWHKIGNVTKSNVYLHTVTWLGGSAMTPSSGNTKLRVVTTFAPPLVMCSTFLYNTSNCLRGVQCVQLSTKNKDEIAVLLADFESKQSLRGINYNVTCCSGISIELLRNLAADLKFDFTLYLVADSEFGVRRNNTWSGLTGDLVSGAAHLAVSSFSVTNSRSRVIDFSVPYFYSDIASVTVRLYKAVPLSAFLVPFSLELWISIFASLNAAAVAAAIYEWLSPFGLNPWGRQRTKNFSLASALWVMWSLLFSHLVAFKAPKSWPNKVLINLWGCFSVIFLASYTANIAALFAGLFFQARVNHVHDAFLLEHRVGTTRGSSTEIYMMKENPRLFQHLQKFSFDNVEDGINKLQNRKLDIIIGDRAILDYYRGRDSDCNLAILGQPLYHDSYAIGVQKGFPMKDAISNLLIKYTEVGHIDDLKAKWYGDMPCFERGADIVRPQALTPNAVAGVFMMLGCGFLVGVLILSLEHLVFKYYLPRLRKKSKKSFWKSPNLMFFSQKLYRFINCVELVSPHHSAKEIASNLRAGQIFSLFQKSVKRKAKEDARRRKSKSLFFEMIQEVTRRKKQSDLSVDEKHSQYRRKSSSKSRRQRNSEIEMISHDTVDSLPIAECHRPKCEESTEECTEQSSLLVKCSGRSNVVSKNEGERSTESVDVVSYYSRPISVSLNDIHMPINEVIDGRCCRFYENFESHPCRNRVHSDSDVLRQLSENIDDSELLTENKSTESAIDVENRLTTKVLPVDEFKLKVLDKDKIVAMWLESEFELRRRLREVIKEKASLESKLSSLQAFLRKPP
ncbi:GRIN3A (predicted) [Pycnogonum litorale]